MINLTDAVARAIARGNEEDEKAIDIARAAIAEFCRYLREPSEELIEAGMNAGWEDQSAQFTADRKDMAIIIRALATHIEGEGK